MSPTWKIGDVADRSGLSVRTLHHYDQIGLLTPCGRTASGHRLYTAEDIQRLHHILALRQVGFPLNEIATFLDEDQVTSAELITLHLQRLKQKQRLLTQQIDRLAALQHTSSRVSVDTVESWFDLIKVMNMIESYYQPEQLEELRARREAIGQTGMQDAERQWRELFDAVALLIEAQADPRGERARHLANQWQGLIRAFTGGNPAIQQSLNHMHNDQPNLLKSFGFEVHPDTFSFINAAIKALNEAPT